LFGSGHESLVVKLNLTDLYFLSSSQFSTIFLIDSFVDFKQKSFNDLLKKFGLFKIEQSI
jgi:hypothetical protein